MKILIGIFEQEQEIETVVNRLLETEFDQNDLALMTHYQAEEVRDVIGEEPTKTAITGTLIGSGIGSTLGLLGSIALLPIPGAGPFLVSGLLTTASSGVLGGYLGSIYAVRAEEQAELELKEALGEDKILLLVQVTSTNEEDARMIMRQFGGGYLKTHEIDSETMPT